MLFVPWHVLAGFPPREASDRAGMGQVDKRKGQLSLDTDTGLWRIKKSGNSWLPFTGAVPHLYEAIILNRRDEWQYINVIMLRVKFYEFKLYGQPKSQTKVTSHLNEHKVLGFGSKKDT